MKRGGAQEHQIWGTLERKSHFVPPCRVWRIRENLVETLWQGNKGEEVSCQLLKSRASANSRTPLPGFLNDPCRPAKQEEHGGGACQSPGPRKYDS